jgi:DNA (cytosine-5)-methyltransferase 1
LENVPNLLAGSHGYFGTILGELAESGYDAVWDCVPASAIGAPHQRDRLWILAWRVSDPGGDGLRDEQGG